VRRALQAVEQYLVLETAKSRIRSTPGTAPATDLKRPAALRAYPAIDP
jgi:hypothetical protein